MFWITVAALVGFGIGLTVGLYILWPYREKYRVCRIERLNNEALVTQIKPKRDAQGKFVRVAA